jgi:hypothetical protein
MTGISEESWPASIALFPNPSKDRFFISTDGLITGMATLNLKDVSGRILNSQELNLINGKTEEINTPYSAGMYVVEIITREKTFLTKLVIE